MIIMFQRTERKDQESINKQGKYRRYEHSMVEASLNLIKELQIKYGITIITFTGKMYLRKVTAFQEDILRYGLSEKAELKVTNKGTESEPVVSGTITTEDEVLRAKVREMSYNEILILKWDEDKTLIEQKQTYVSMINEENLNNFRLSHDISRNSQSIAKICLKSFQF